MSCLSFISNQDYTIPSPTKTICPLKADLPLMHKQSFKPRCTSNSQYYPVGLSVMDLKKLYSLHSAIDNKHGHKCLCFTQCEPWLKIAFLVKMRLHLLLTITTRT